MSLYDCAIFFFYFYMSPIQKGTASYYCYFRSAGLVTKAKQICIANVPPYFINIDDGSEFK